MTLFFSAFIIFLLRRADHSLGTMRVLLVNKNKPGYAALIGLFESAIWIVAVSQVVKDINDPILIASEQRIYTQMFRKQKIQSVYFYPTFHFVYTPLLKMPHFSMTHFSMPHFSKCPTFLCPTFENAPLFHTPLFKMLHFCERSI